MSKTDELDNQEVKTLPECGGCANKRTKYGRCHVFHNLNLIRRSGFWRPYGVCRAFLLFEAAKKGE